MIRDNDPKKVKFSTSNKVTTFADLLSDEQRDLLVSRSSTPPKTFPPLKARDFEFVLPLTPRTAGRTSQEVLQCKVKIRNTKKLFESVLWCAIYGSTHYTIFLWYMLFNIFSKTICNDKKSEALLSILRITSTAEAGIDLKHHLKPVKTVVTKCFEDKELALKYCKKLERMLGVELPHQAPKLTELFELFLKTKTFRRPPEKRRVGVGYNDKGHLPKDSSREESVSGEDYSLPENDIFVDLLTQTREALAFCTSYDDKKRKKLLQKIESDLSKDN